MTPCYVLSDQSENCVTSHDYFTVQFNHIYIFGFSVKLAMQDFHPCSHQSLVLKPGIICTFLIHSGNLQKMLTTLFNLVWNTQKVNGLFIFETHNKHPCKYWLD